MWKCNKKKSIKNVIKQQKIEGEEITRENLESIISEACKDNAHAQIKLIQHYTKKIKENYKQGNLDVECEEYEKVNCTNKPNSDTLDCNYKDTNNCNIKQLVKWMEKIANNKDNIRYIEMNDLLGKVIIPKDINSNNDTNIFFKDFIGEEGYFRIAYDIQKHIEYKNCNLSKKDILLKSESYFDNIPMDKGRKLIKNLNLYIPFEDENIKFLYKDGKETLEWGFKQAKQNADKVDLGEIYAKKYAKNYNPEFFKKADKLLRSVLQKLLQDAKAFPGMQGAEKQLLKGNLQAVCRNLGVLYGLRYEKYGNKVDFQESKRWFEEEMINGGERGEGIGHLYMKKYEKEIKEMYKRKSEREKEEEIAREKMLKSFQEAEKWLTGDNDDDLIFASGTLLNKLGSLYSLRYWHLSKDSDFNKALDQFLQVLKIGNFKETTYAYINLGTLYYERWAKGCLFPLISKIKICKDGDALKAIYYYKMAAKNGNKYAQDQVDFVKSMRK